MNHPTFFLSARNTRAFREACNALGIRLQVFYPAVDKNGNRKIIAYCEASDAQAAKELAVV